MLASGSILVVDDSRLMRQVMEALLVPHCREILTASTLQQGLAALESHRDIEIVLCSVALRDGDGFALVERCGSLAPAGPAAILMTTRWVPDHAQRAAALGALGYLTKPISLRDIRLCRERALRLAYPATRVRRRTLAKAWLVEEDRGRDSLLSWDLHNVSETGAFLETKGPLPIGSELDLEIPLGEDTIRVTVEVVRVQEPSWMHVGGVGVRFQRLDDRSRSTLQRFVAGEIGVWPDVIFANEQDAGVR